MSGAAMGVWKDAAALALGIVSGVALAAAFGGRDPRREDPAIAPPAIAPQEDSKDTVAVAPTRASDESPVAPRRRTDDARAQKDRATSRFIRIEDALRQGVEALAADPSWNPNKKILTEGEREELGTWLERKGNELSSLTTRWTGKSYERCSAALLRGDVMEFYVLPSNWTTPLPPIPVLDPDEANMQFAVGDVVAHVIVTPEEAPELYALKRERDAVADEIEARIVQAFSPPSGR